MGKLSESIYPNEGSPFYCDKDLLNEKLTWRLYDQSTKELILRGFYDSDGSFSINHEYTNAGTGLANSPIEQLKISTLSNVRKFLRSQGMTTYGYRALRNLEGNGTVRALEDLIGMEGTLTERWDQVLNSSEIISQKDLSKLYESTNISIPSISELTAVIWTESPENTCISIWESIYEKYFIGDFNNAIDTGITKSELGDGGYWTAPNNIDMTNNPLSDDELRGGFRLSTSSYEFTDLLLKSVSWTYSREFAVVGVNNVPTKLNVPAYVSIRINLDIYKYLTKKMLKKIYKYSR